MIIGAMKCATSSLYYYLVEHPEICSCVVKEPEFFSENQYKDYSVERYGNLWNFDPTIHRYVLEASTGYSKYPDVLHVPEKICNYRIKPMFIYIVRNPFGRILSHYYHLRENDTVERVISLTSDHLINVSNYFLQLEQYRKYFPRESFLILDFDDLKRSPESVLRRVCKFLRLSDAYLPTSFPIYNKTPSSLKGKNLLRSNSYAKKISRLMPPPVRALSKIVLQPILRAQEKEFSDYEYDTVFNRLKDDMKHFQEEYGFNVGQWGF